MMALRQVYVPSLDRRLSNLMAGLSSSAPQTHEAGLDAFYALGGNCLHLHGEGGEMHSRQAAGEWLKRHQLREDFFLCTQICHEAWDAVNQRSIDRFEAGPVEADIATDLGLLGTAYIDFVYLDDSPQRPVELVLDALHHEISRGRLRAWGVRNWSIDRIRFANAYAKRRGMAGVAAVVTTELALPTAARPLWPGYSPFNLAMKQFVCEIGAAVFAHAADFTSGQAVVDRAHIESKWPPAWHGRWDHSSNAAFASRLNHFADAENLTARAVLVGSLLNQAFPTVGIVDMPSFLQYSDQYTAASLIRIDEATQVRILSG